MGVLRVEHAHSFSIEQARERVKALGAYLSNKHGAKVEWTDQDHAAISVKYMVASFELKVWLEGSKVVVEAPDPGMLLRGKAREYAEKKLVKYLDPKTAVEALPTR